MKKKKKYLVFFHVMCEQSIEVEAYSKEEAKEKAKVRDGEPFDFNVLYNMWSTMRVEEMKNKC